MSSRHELSAVIRRIAEMGFSPGTGGNFSLRVGSDPLTLLMSPSGVDKRSISPDALIEVNEEGIVVNGDGTASAETLLHLTIIKATGAHSVLHTHSVWNTLLSEKFCDQGSLTITGYEMLKTLSGVTTHQHEEVVPILENTQDMKALAQQLLAVLTSHPKAHGVLLSGHGLYTWGDTLYSALRHVEGFEFLFEVLGRKK